MSSVWDSCNPADEKDMSHVRRSKMTVSRKRFSNVDISSRRVGLLLPIELVTKSSRACRRHSHNESHTRSSTWRHGWDSF
ncbi:hypothetical protein SCLCIDRAFT_1219890 [Scleroderma citrinum Foug A]|uniref:Uncharacterized protein n=1 Tax=Scleroderma citrinum Foug A TaxID=1036808 RepID=A0A0C3DKM5_9AGAM|nr:hypothetical protein SCLCIDRAFT_1219890 [Scleroderma citrinum Foug A]